MTTRQLHQAISRATGEDVELIARRGFSLVENDQSETDEDWAALALDWDRLDAKPQRASHGHARAQPRTRTAGRCRPFLWK